MINHALKLFHTPLNFNRLCMCEEPDNFTHRGIHKTGKTIPW